MQLKALKEFRHAGTLLQPGDPFTATERDGKILLVIGKAEARQEAPNEPETVLEPAKRAKSRTYKRRDMTAE